VGRGDVGNAIVDEGLNNQVLLCAACHRRAVEERLPHGESSAGSGIEVVKIPPRSLFRAVGAHRPGWGSPAGCWSPGRGTCAVLDEYAARYSQHRPHPGRNLRPPDCDGITMAATGDLAAAGIRWRRVLGGLVNEYERAA
jgi:hypothetical protein